MALNNISFTPIHKYHFGCSGSPKGNMIFNRLEAYNQSMHSIYLWGPHGQVDVLIMYALKFHRNMCLTLIQVSHSTKAIVCFNLDHLSLLFPYEQLLFSY